MICSPIHLHLKGAGQVHGQILERDSLVDAELREGCHLLGKRTLESTLAGDAAVDDLLHCLQAAVDPIFPSIGFECLFWTRVRKASMV